MKLVTVNTEDIPIGLPLPFSLRDEAGALLAIKGYVVYSHEDLEQVISHRGHVYIDSQESDMHRRAYVGKLMGMLQEDVSLKQIAESQFSTLEATSAFGKETESDVPDWRCLQEQANAMLRDKNGFTFLKKLNELQRQISLHSRQSPDGTLLALTYLTSNEMRMYSATHGMLVAVMCSIAAREVLKWTEDEQVTLCKAALTMNLSMTDLQDHLSQQREAPNQEQSRQIKQHAIRSVIMLEQIGVVDKVWLEAVLDHHNKAPGPLLPRTAGQRMARLIQRADIFAACLAPRAARLPANPAMAMKSCYYDENQDIDEAGSALVKTMGIYSPGSFVRLSTQEIGVVIKRGFNTTTPRVAVIINRSGMPISDYIVRDTRQKEFKIISSVARRDVKVNINLDRMMALAKNLKSDFPW